MILARFGAQCSAGGLDLCQALRVDWYNNVVDEPLQLPTFGVPNRLAAIVGNTSALWRPLLSSLRVNPELMSSSNPVEDYCVELISSAAAATGTATEIRWAHSVGRGMVAIQRLAQLAGLAFLSPAHLSVHATYGPWIALRAVAVFDVAAPNMKAPRMVSPCDRCDEGCKRVFDQVSQKQYAGWRDWLAVRDACPHGREHRYCEDQIIYHYKKDPRTLRTSANKDDFERR